MASSLCQALKRALWARGSEAPCACCSQAAAAVLLTPANKQAFNTQQVLTGAGLAAYLGTNPDRVPDLFVVPVPGTVYTGSLAKGA